MIKLNASYSKKVPASEKYSSESYLACVEVELPTGASPQELQEEIHRTFQLVKESVEAEIAGQVARDQAQEHQEQRHGHSRSNTAEGKASNKQIGYLLDLARARDIPLMQLNADVQTRFNAASVYELSRRDCSRLIDEFQRAA